MESTGVAGRIHVSQAAFEKLQHSYLFEERGVQSVKGSGQMLTYLFKERKFTRTASGHFIRKATLSPPAMRKRGSGTITPPGSTKPSRDNSTATTGSVNDPRKNLSGLPL